ncbi:hypothetical protein Aperf_G00000075624 [Anoplocephala perfoliata]
MFPFKVKRYCDINGDDFIGSDYDEPAQDEYDVDAKSFSTCSGGGFSGSLSLMHEEKASTPSQTPLTSDYHNHFAQNNSPTIPPHGNTLMSNESYYFGFLKPDALLNNTQSAQSILESVPPPPPKRWDSLKSRQINNYHFQNLYTSAYFEDTAAKNSQDKDHLFPSGYKVNGSLSASVSVHNNECKEVTELTSELERFAFSQP